MRNNRVWYHFEGEIGARCLDSKFTRCCVDASDKVPYKAGCPDYDWGSTELYRYDMRDNTCSAYGLLAGERVTIDQEYAIGMKSNIVLKL